MRQYELVMVLDPEVDEERLNNVMDRVRRVLTDNGGEVTNENDWGTRKLAYKIGRFSEGHYHVVQLSMEAAQSKEVDGVLKLADDVIRHVLVLEEH